MQRERELCTSADVAPVLRPSSRHEVASGSRLNDPPHLLSVATGQEWVGFGRGQLALPGAIGGVNSTGRYSGRARRPAPWPLVLFHEAGLSVPLVRRQRSNVTAGKTVKTVGILRGARNTQLKLGVNENGLGSAMYRNIFVGAVVASLATVADVSSILFVSAPPVGPFSWTRFPFSIALNTAFHE